MSLAIRLFAVCTLAWCINPLGASAALDWVPVSDAEKAMKENPLDPGAGAVVLFKRGEMRVEERTAGFWLTTIETYVRIKVFNEAGLKAADVSFEASRYRRFKGAEGRTILPNGQVIPLEAGKVFSGRSYETGSGAVFMKTSFALPGAEPGAILEYRMTAGKITDEREKAQAIYKFK